VFVENRDNFRRHALMSAIDPKRTSAKSSCNEWATYEAVVSASNHHAAGNPDRA
jgi:hypothetical protein